MEKYILRKHFLREVSILISNRVCFRARKITRDRHYKMVIESIHQADIIDFFLKYTLALLFS